MDDDSSCPLLDDFLRRRAIHLSLNSDMPASVAYSRHLATRALATQSALRRLQEAGMTADEAHRHVAAGVVPRPQTARSRRIGITPGLAEALARYAE